LKTSFSDAIQPFWLIFLSASPKVRITLTDENWKKIDELLERIPDSGFLRFCLMDEIAGEGLEQFESKFVHK